MTRPPSRIVVVGPAYPYRGGIAHSLEAMYWTLERRGHDVSIVTFTRQYPKLLFPGTSQYEDEPLKGTLDVVRLVDSIGPHTWFRAARHIAAQKPDAVIFKYWMPFFAPAYGTIARRLRRQGIRCLTLIDNALPHEPHAGDRLLSRYFLAACDGHVVMSKSVEIDLQSLGITAPVRRTAHPVYDVFGKGVPVEEARRRLGLPVDAPVLLFFGFIRKYKGLQVLLDAMPAVLARVPDARLVVAGEFYDDEAPYRELIRRHNLEKHILLQAGYIPNGDIPLYFSAADLVVQPYLSATQSGVAQIAYHFDRPLVVTDVGGLAEVVPHEVAGLIVPPDDPAALAAAIVRFFRENMKDTLAQGVRIQKKEYSWDRLCEAVESLL